MESSVSVRGPERSGWPQWVVCKPLRAHTTAECAVRRAAGHRQRRVALPEPVAQRPVALAVPNVPAPQGVDAAATVSGASGSATPAAAVLPSPPVVMGKANAIGADTLSWLGSRGGSDAPALVPLAWSVAAASRRELSGGIGI